MPVPVSFIETVIKQGPLFAIACFAVYLLYRYMGRVVDEERKRAEFEKEDKDRLIEAITDVKLVVQKNTNVIEELMRREAERPRGR